MTAVLSQRELNRATLARQQLIQRADRPVADVVEHLVGLQAQTPHSWHVGLWSRIANFQPEDAAAQELVQEGQRLLAFTDPAATDRRVEITSPAHPE